MKKYFLLRNNSESGPHSLEELKNLGVFTRDLVWIEGSSRNWVNADQLDEFKSWTKNPERKQPVFQPHETVIRTGQDRLQLERINYLNPPSFALQERQATAEWDNRFLWPTKKSRKDQHPLKAIALLVVIFSGLIAGAMVIKHLTADVQPEYPGNFRKEIKAVSQTSLEPGNDIHKQKAKKQAVLGQATKTQDIK